MKTMKLLPILLTLALLIGLLPGTASAAPAFDSEETICLYVGQRIQYQSPEPFALDYAGLKDYFKSDSYYARAYTAEVVFGEKPDWFCIGIQPSKPGRFLYYGYTEPGAGTDFNINPYYTIKDADKGAETFYLMVTMALSGAGTKTVVHKVTLIVEDEPRVASERTVHLLPDKEPVDGRAVIRPGELAQGADLAFPLPEAAWKTVEPEEREAGPAAFFRYDWTGEMPPGLAMSTRHVSDVPYYMPDWEENSGPYFYRFDYARPTDEGEYTVLFRIRPRAEGEYFAPFNYRVRFVVSCITEEYDLWAGGERVNNANCASVAGNGEGGSISYDPLTRTLEVSGSWDFESESEPFIRSSIDGLTIRVNGDTRISSEMTALELHGHTLITGEGKLLLEAESGAGIEVCDGKRLTVDLRQMSASGGTGGILGSAGAALDVVRAVTAESAAGAITGFSSVYWDDADAALTAPSGGYFADGAIVDSKGKVAARAAVTWYQPYDIWIDGERITERNWLARKSDVLFYNAVSNILYIRGGSCTATGYAPLVRSSIEGLIISVHGDTTLTMPDGAMYPIFELSGDTEINSMKGKTLTLECGEWVMDACIEVLNSTLTLNRVDGLTLRHEGGSALRGGGAKLVVEESVVTAECGGEDAYSAAVTGFSGGIELHWCAADEPVACGVDADGSFTDGEGRLAKRVAISRRPKLTIDRITGSGSSGNLRWKIEYLPEGGQQLRLVAAAYDGAGRLAGISFKDMTDAEGTAEGYIATVGSARIYRLFLLDSGSRPAAECTECRRS